MSVHTGRHGSAIGGETSEVFSSVFYPLGTRTNDANGNEYVFVNFNGLLAVPGEFVVFDHNFAATRLSSTSRGYVGVVMSATVTAANKYGWVQVYGVHTAAAATSDVTTALPVYAPVTTDIGALQLPTSADTLVAIRGVIARTAPDTCASTALVSSAVPGYCTVQLNYPFVDGSYQMSS